MYCHFKSNRATARQDAKLPSKTRIYMADSRWKLTEEENKWAKELKQALADEGVPPPATDFEISRTF